MVGGMNSGMMGSVAEDRQAGGTLVGPNGEPLRSSRETAEIERLSAEVAELKRHLADAQRTDGERRGGSFRGMKLARRKAEEYRFDVFISHAHEDKEDVALPLARMLTDRGVKVWIDDFELKVGDSLSRKIDHGLSNSRFGIVILSNHFFSKEWTQRELEGLRAKEHAEATTILPIWHKVTRDEVVRFSPILADKVSLNTTTLSLVEIADRLFAVIS